MESVWIVRVNNDEIIYGVYNSEALALRHKRMGGGYFHDITVTEYPLRDYFDAEQMCGFDD